MKVNDWSKSEVDRAVRTWGSNYPPYSQDMYSFAIADVSSWLDLGCGFGRFFRYLLKNVEEPNYIGYDSSSSMLKQFKKNFPEFSPLVFEKDITSEIIHQQSSIISSAVLIHITEEDQRKVLQNVLEASPNKFSFDINCPSESYLSKGGKTFERFIKCSEGNFRMTWQSHYEMTRYLLSTFTGYSVSHKLYTINTNRHKVVYFLEKL